jgi:hypothetical protein
MGTAKRVLITQSNYIPWKGYFDNLARCDVFVVYDDMQYTRRDWRNRNQVKTKDGLKWLTVPVAVKGKYDQAINQTRIDGQAWRRNHLETLHHAYAKAPHFKVVHDWLTEVYMEMDFDLLTDLNVHLLRKIGLRLGINTEFRDSREFRLEGDRTERLVNICKALGADEYLTGPAAKTYMEEGKFNDAGVRVTYSNYKGYPEYPQQFPPFIHSVSILDVLYNCGGNARNMIHVPGSSDGTGERHS